MNTVKKKAEMTKEKKLMGVQQCLIKADKETMAVLEYLCSESNKLHNCAVYLNHAESLRFLIEG